MNKKEKKAGVILLISIIIFIVSLSLIVKFVDLNSKNGFIIMISFLAYIVLAFWMGSLVNKTTNKSLKFFFHILSFPAAIIYVILRLGFPFVAVMMNFIGYSMLSILPTMLIIGLNELNIIIISYEKQIFLILTIATIVSVAFNKYILKLILKYSPVVRNNPEREDTIEIIKLTEYLFNPNNIRFIIYLLYFVFLIFFSLAYLDGSSVFNNKLLDNVVLQAFLVFLAYDSLRINSKGLKLFPTFILNKIWNVFKYDVTDESGKGKKEK